MNQDNSSIQFLLGNVLQNITFGPDSILQPCSSILDYLRTHRQLKGSKEGCREGDCGACTIVVGSLDNEGQMQYNALNSCLIMLPFLHGKQLICIEHIAINENSRLRLHPVQQLIIDKFGSQCGFCTPGVIMSLFGIYKSTEKPKATELKQILTGNLCRCTGYKPIFEAALDVIDLVNHDHFSEDEANTIEQLQRIKNSNLHLKTNNQEYFRPSNFNDALLIRKSHPDIKTAFGFTDAAHQILDKPENRTSILDLSGSNHNQLLENKDHWVLQSGITFTELRKYGLKIPLIKELTDVFASLQIRNMASLAGNLASASPVGDSIPVLMALNAKVRLASAHQNREMYVRDFITGYRQTQLKSNELIDNIIIPKPSVNQYFRYFKTSRRHDVDISSVSLAAMIDLDGGIIKDIRIFFGGMAATTLMAVKTSESLQGKPFSKDNFTIAESMIGKDFSPISDARSSEKGRILMARGLMSKLYESIIPKTDHE
ncbi:MAG: FAD binding domain-containing protein [Bacteroidales bacterium]|nr:FAD binding domain-containing protein [Bacteroidales bacterium]